MSYSFNAIKERQNIIKWLKDIVPIMKSDKVIIGISGGKDSTVCAALCVEAFGKDNVYGILMPNGEQADIEDAKKVCEILDIKYNIINISYIYKTFMNYIEFSTDISLSKESLINLQPRIRMTILYTLAQTLGMRVCGTGNLSEKTVGYFTKWGDGAYDFNPIGNLTSKEVVEIGLTYDNIPKELILKTPTDGLSGMTDEEKLGISYDSIHNYLRDYKNFNNVDEKNKIKNKEIGATHKNRPPIIYPDVWGVNFL